VIDPAEVWQSCEPLGPELARWLSKTRIRIPTLWRMYGMMLQAPIVVRGETFVIAPHGSPAIITPVRVDPDEYDPERALPTLPETLAPDTAPMMGDIIDLVAWHPRKPDRWACLTGDALTLGACLPQTFDDPAPVRVHGSIAGWFAANLDGIFILAQRPADRMAVLQSLAAIIPDDEDHATELRQQATLKPRAPKMVIDARR
jgi:hypothetical protein